MGRSVRNTSAVSLVVTVNHSRYCHTDSMGTTTVATIFQITETKVAVAHLTAPQALHFSSISSFLFRTLITVSGLPQE